MPSCLYVSAVIFCGKKPSKNVTSCLVVVLYLGQVMPFPAPTFGSRFVVKRMR